MVVNATTLYNTHELARATHLVTLKDIMADKLAKERFCNDKISYTCIYNELRDCLVLQQS